MTGRSATIARGLAALRAAKPRSVLRSAWPWMAPALFTFLLFYVVPLGRMVYRSLTDPVLSLQHYRHLLVEAVYRDVFWLTVEVSGLVTVGALLAGYPVAYLLATLRGRAVYIVLVLVLLPFWISALVRNYAWIALLARNGLINTYLIKLGIITTPLPFMFNLSGVVIVMTYVLVPFMILSLYGVMRGIDRRLVRASASLGASRLQTFWYVFFPLSLPGVWAGCLLVFITAMGFYITPMMLGGGRVPMVAVLIDNQVRNILNWGLASALACTLLLAVLVIYYVFDRVLGIDRLMEGRH